MKNKIILFLTILAIVLIAGIFLKKCSCNPEPAPDYSEKIRKPPTKTISKTNDGTIPIIDSAGNTIRVKVPNAKNIKSVISIKNPPDSSGNPVNPTTLLVERTPPGFLPEIFGGDKITIKSFGNDSNVTVLDLEDKTVDFENNLTAGILYSRKGIEPTFGVNLIKLSFLHVSANVSYNSSIIKPDLDLNCGLKLELLPYIFTGYSYGVLSGEHKVSLEYCYKFN